MDLRCCESTVDVDCRAYCDPTIYDSDRVLNNMLQAEEGYMPSTSYFKCVQTDVRPNMRKIVADWMLEVCEDQHCQEEVFPLAMNFLDRFLSVCRISRRQLQLLGAVCLFLSSKLKESGPLSGEKLVIYTDNSISLELLWQWELLVLSKLKWDLSAITPHDFLDHIFRRISLDRSWDLCMLRRHAQTFIALCSTDFKFSIYTPSMIAAASIGAAIHGLGWKPSWPLSQLLDRLHQITSIETDCLRGCLEQIEEMLQVNINSSQSCQTAERSRTDLPSCDKLGEHEKAETPTDTRDIHF